MKLREGKMFKGNHNDSPKTTRPENKPSTQGINKNMKTFICFYNEEYIMNHCVKIQALDYNDAEYKFRYYLAENKIGYIDEDKLHIEDINEILYELKEITKHEQI